MWEGYDGVDPTSERIFTEIKKHFNNKCGKVTMEWTQHRKEFSLKLRDILTSSAESDDGVNPTPKRIFTEIKKHLNNKCGKVTMEWTQHRKEFSLKFKKHLSTNVEK